MNTRHNILAGIKDNTLSKKNEIKKIELIRELGYKNATDKKQNNKN